MKRLYFFTIFVILGFQLDIIAQAQKNPKRFYIENLSKKSITVPFKLINNLVVLTVKLNNSDTLNFILDSGISNTLLTDPEIAAKLNLKLAKDIKLFGFGNGDALTATHSIENEIRIQGIVGLHQDILVISNPEFDFSRHLGVKIHGLLGYNLFRDLIIEINYENKQISFHTPKTYVYKLKKKSTTIPITIVDSKPFVTAPIMQEDSTVVEGRFLIDSGASFALWIDLESNPKYKIPSKTEPIYMGVGLGGEVFGRAGRIKQFGTGFMKLNNLIASYSDTNRVVEKNTNIERNGSIGADLLSRFHVIFDYRNNKITFRPNSKWKEPFHVNLSGMEVCCPTPGKNAYTIASITAKSPAENAGLKVGDLIENINYQQVSELSLSEIHGLLLKKPYRKMLVQYRREGKLQSTTLLFKDCI